MKKILLLLLFLAVFLIGICVSAVSADNDGNNDTSDTTFAQNMQNLVNGKESPITSKDINNTPGLSGKLVMGQCALLNMSKEDLNKAKEIVKKPTDEQQQQPTKSRSFMEWLGEHPEIGQDIDNQVERLENPDSSKWMSQATKLAIKELEKQDGLIPLIKIIHLRATDAGHKWAISGAGLLPQKDPRSI